MNKIVGRCFRYFVNNETSHSPRLIPGAAAEVLMNTLFVACGHTMSYFACSSVNNTGIVKLC